MELLSIDSRYHDLIRTWRYIDDRRSIVDRDVSSRLAIPEPVKRTTSGVVSGKR